MFKAGGIENFYMMYFQEPGVAEGELEVDIARLLRSAYYSWSGSRPEGKNWNPVVPPGNRLLDTTFDAPMPLTWLSVAHLGEYIRDFTTSGFRGGLNWVPEPPPQLGANGALCQRAYPSALALHRGLARRRHPHTGQGRRAGRSPASSARPDQRRSR